MLVAALRNIAHNRCQNLTHNMVVGGEYINPIGLDFAVIAVIASILIALAVRLYPRLIQ